MNYRFCYQDSVNKGVPAPCTAQIFHALLNSDGVEGICKQIASLDKNDPQFEEKKAALKKRLPILIPHAQAFKKDTYPPAPFLKETRGDENPNDNHNGGGPRKSSLAIPSGLVMLDVDHVEDPHAKWQEVLDRLNSLPSMKEGCPQGGIDVPGESIYFASVTPSGHGLRIIAERKLLYSPEGEIVGAETIEAAQQRIAGACGFDEIDGVTTDLARASYLVPISYVLYLNEQGLFSFPDSSTEEYWKNANDKSPFPQPLSPERARGENTADASAETDLPCPSRGKDTAEPEERGSGVSYKGIPYKRIIDRLLLSLCPDGNVSLGERNTVFFSLAIHMRYITDFNAELLLHVLPDFGLTEQERKQTIHSALGRPRKGECPMFLQSVIALVEQELNQEKQMDTADLQPLQMPRLPRLLSLVCRRLPAEYRPAMIIASLPVLGTLATRIRFNYLDQQEHSLSFFSIITAPAASGKSFLRRPLDLLLTPINEQDEIERQKEQTYKEKLRASKNSKNQPEDPRACPRNNGIAISVAKLLQLLTYSGGKHLFGFSEELDSLVKSEKAGVWSQKGDIYRMAFDNSEYGQAYMSDNSFSAKVPVYYNLLLTGTPRSLDRFFKSDNIENGLMTRTCIAELPDTSYSQMPRFEPYTDREREEIIRWARMLDQEEGHIQCPVVETAIDQWQEEKRQRALDADSHAADILRRRAAVIGYRAGMLCYLLEGRANKKSVGEFAVWVAEYVFRNQLKLYGEKLEQACNASFDKYTPMGAASALINLLPHEFETKDLIALRAKKGQSVQPCAVGMLLTRWKQSGRIEQIAPTRYRKLQ